MRQKGPGGAPDVQRRAVVEYPIVRVAASRFERKLASFADSFQGRKSGINCRKVPTWYTSELAGRLRTGVRASHDHPPDA